MGNPLLHVSAQVTCPHLAKASDASTNTRVKVSGMAVATAVDGWQIAGCPFQVPAGATTKPQPCVTIQWSRPATRVKVNGSFALLQSSQGLCKSAEQIAQGLCTAVTQTRARGK
ncbi:hypothetical protein WME98_45285 [Sorangium sp. So ce296]|uniref:hypothetical protein n=1 Tax=unclassified Sorangium TaxID=2621164 RepID=UPI003F610828